MDIQQYQPHDWDISFDKSDEIKIDQDLLILKNILGDQRRYLQILQNFLSNALKFTSQNGTIHIRISLLEKQNQNSDAQQNYLKKKVSETQLHEYFIENEISKDPFQQKSKKKFSRAFTLQADDKKKLQQFKDFFSEVDSNEKFIKIKIEIIDSGVGIKKENLSKLFMDFGKLDEHSKMNASGTGLGLSICKRMIEQMGGIVKVDSIEGLGTTFTINLSMQAKMNNEVQKELKLQEQNNQYQQFQNNSKILLNNFIFNNQQPQIKKKLPRTTTYEETKQLQDQDTRKRKFRCIIANDDQFQLMNISNTLTIFGVEVIKECMNGLQAFQFVLQNQELKIDFILLDLEMPIMNGYEACQKICQIYDQDNKIFKIKSKSNNVKLSNSYMDYSLQVMFKSVYDKLQEIDQIPLMIAYSELVDQNVIQKANLNGFEIVIQSPLTAQIIKDEILQRLKMQYVEQDNKSIKKDNKQKVKFAHQTSKNFRFDYLQLCQEQQNQAKMKQFDNFNIKESQIKIESQNSNQKNQNSNTHKKLAQKSVSFLIQEDNSSSYEEEN